MKPIDYLHLQMELEGIQVRDGNLITRLHPNVEDFPLVLYADLKSKNKVVYFDATMPLTLLHKLATVDLKFFKIETAVEVFDSQGINVKVESSKTYVFPENFAVADVENVSCFSQTDPRVAAFGFDGLGEKVYAIERDGKIVSACVSSRQNSKAAESWVFTHPDHRQKGLAQQVVTAWAKSLLNEGKVPFYSHVVENIASAKVASRMQLVHMYDETVIEHVE